MCIIPNSAADTIIIYSATGSTQPANSAFVEIARVVSENQSEAGIVYEDYLPVDGITRWYCFSEMGTGQLSSSWIGPISATPQQGNYSVIPTNSRPVAAYAALATVDGTILTANASSSVTQLSPSGSTAYAIMKGHDTDTVMHGQHYNFQKTYDKVPVVLFDASSGISYNTSSTWSTSQTLSNPTLPPNNNPQSRLFTANNLTNTGFDASLLLTQAGGGLNTIISSSFTGSNMHSVGDTVTINGNTSIKWPSYNNIYIPSFSVGLKVVGGLGAAVSADIDVAFDLFVSGSWLEVDDNDFATAGNTTASGSWSIQSLIGNGLLAATASSEMRLRIAGINSSPPNATVTAVVIPIDCRWISQSGLPDQFSSATPINTPAVRFHVFATT